MESDEQKPRYRRNGGSGRRLHSSQHHSNHSSDHSLEHVHQKKGVISSIIDSICKLVFILTVAIIVGGFVVVLTTNNNDLIDIVEQSGDILSKLTSLPSSPPSSHIILKKWEDIKLRAMSIYFATTASSEAIQETVRGRANDAMTNNGKKMEKKTHKKVISDKVELGRTLLKSGDPVGAEKVCKNEIDLYKKKKKEEYQKGTNTISNFVPTSTTSDEGSHQLNNYVKALVCLGEARLALHNAAWNSGVVISLEQEPSPSPSSDKERFLHLAKRDFYEAVELEPTNLNARHGLGLSYFLIATRELHGQPQQQTSSTQLLFNSILHFEAISVLSSSPYYSSSIIHNHNEDDEEDVASDEAMQNIRISAMYNNGLAHIAMNDIKSAIPILHELSKMLEAITTESSSPSLQYKGLLSSVKTNLGAALLQRDATDQALKAMDTSSVIQYCKPEGINGIDELVELPYWKQRYIQKQCAILSNNIAVANEKIGKNDDGDHEGDESESSFLKLSLIYERMLSLESPSFAAMNAIAKYGANDNPQLTMKLDPDVPKSEDNVNVVKGIHDDTVDELLTLSKTKIDIGDFEGAIDAARKALNQATNLDEMKLCTYSLGGALSQLSDNDVVRNEVESSISIVDNNESASDSSAKILHLEEEVAKLKQQLKEAISKQRDAIFNIAQESHESISKVTSKQEVDRSDEIHKEPADSQSQKIDDEQEQEEKVLESENDDSSTSDKNDTTDIKEPSIAVATHTPDTNSATSMPSVDDSKKGEDSSKVEVDEHNESETADEPVVTDKAEAVKDDENKAKGATAVVPEVTKNESIVLPALFEPDEKEAEAIDASSEGYMKVADAYIQKQNYKLASKQFLKVLKKNKRHIPALLGYATSMERHVKPKQMSDVAMAYANVTVSALEQGNLNLATATFRRSLKVSENIVDDERIDILQHLARISFNEDIAAQIYYEIGSELLKMKSSNADVMDAFKISNGFGAKKDSIYSSMSKYQIAKTKLAMDDDLENALQLVESALDKGLDALQVEALVLSGTLKEKLSNINEAIKDYEKAIELPKTDATATAHYRLGLALRSKGGDTKTVENHIEFALNMGLDPTAEAMEILGEHHIAIVKSAHRAEWNRYKKSLETAENNTNRSGILNGSGVSSESVFAKKDGEIDDSPDTLSMLEQGAAAYDGSSVPSGDETSDDTSSLPNHQRSTSSKVNTN